VSLRYEYPRISREASADVDVVKRYCKKQRKLLREKKALEKERLQLNVTQGGRIKPRIKSPHSKRRKKNN
jgi:hypothetical protein